jgi:hypothetical protein
MPIDPDWVESLSPYEAQAVLDKLAEHFKGRPRRRLKDMKPDEARAALKALDEQKPPYTVREVAKGTAAGAASKGGQT